MKFIWTHYKFFGHFDARLFTLLARRVHDFSDSQSHRISEKKKI